MVFSNLSMNAYQSQNLGPTQISSRIILFCRLLHCLESRVRAGDRGSGKGLTMKIGQGRFVVFNKLPIVGIFPLASIWIQTPNSDDRVVTGRVNECAGCLVSGGGIKFPAAA